MYRIISVFLFSLTSALAGQLVLTVADSHTGTPIAHAQVLISGPEGQIADADTEATGSYTLDRISAGQYQMTITKANYLKTIAMVMATQVESVIKARVSLVPTGVVTGRVKDSQDRGLRGARVFLVPGDPIGSGPLLVPSPVYSDATDDTGRYRVHGIVPGTYSIGAVVPAQRRLPNQLLFAMGTRQTVHVLEGGVPLETDFTAMHGSSGSIIGRLDANGRCDFDGYSVALAAVEQPRVLLQTAMVSKDRTFRFDDLPPGSYVLFVAGRTIGRAAQGQVLSSERCFARQEVTVTQTAQEIALMTAPAASVNVAPTLSEQEPDCRKPVAVRLTPIEAWNALTAVDAALDPMKETVITGLAPGRHVLTSYGLCAVRAQEILAGSGAPNQSIKTSRVHGAIIEGKILLRSAASSVEILLQQSGAAEVISTTCIRDGTFRFPQVAEGRYRVLLRGASGAATHDVSATRGTTYVEIPEP